MADMDIEIVGDRLGARTGYAARSVLKEVPGALWSAVARCWTYPLAYPSALALGEAAKRLGETITPTAEAAEWVQAEMTAWGVLSAESARLVPEAEAVEGFFPHQVQCARWLSLPGAKGGRLDTSQTGSGKTRASLRAAWECWSQGETGILLVSTLMAVKHGWRSEVAAVSGLLPLPGGQKWQVFSLPNGASIGKRRTILAEAAAASEAAGGVGVVLLTNHEQLRTHSRLSGYGDIALRRCPKCGGVRAGEDVVTEAKCQAHDKELNKLDYVAVVYDECFVPTALVDTPSGPREIGSLQEGDLVWGFNEETGKVEATKVRAVMHRKSAVVGGFVTPGHPVRVSSGYVPVADLRENDLAITIRGSGVPTLRQDVLGSAVSGSPWAEVLFEDMFRRGADVHGGGPGTLAGGAGEDGHTARRAGEAVSASVRANEPLPGPRGAGAAQAGRVHVPGARREWSRTDGTTSLAVVGTRGRLDLGVRGTGAGESSRSEVVRTGSGAPGKEDLRGGGWELAPRPEGEGAGLPEGCVSGLGRLDGSEVHEPRNPDGASRVRVGDPVEVVNIETSTSNYFVHGLLVHNCHRMMEPKAQLTRAAWAIADRAPRTWGLTGTPGSRSAMENTWALQRLVYGKGWPSKSSWTKYFAECGYSSLGFWEVGRLRAERSEEFQKTYSSLSRRVLKEQVLDLPPLLRGGTLERFIPMTGEQLTAYNTMRDELWLKVAEGEVTAANMLVQVGRLTMLANATGIPGPDYGKLLGYQLNAEGQSVPVYNAEMKLRMPSNKVTALVDMIASGDLDEGAVFQFVHPDLLYMLRNALVEKKVISRAEEFGVIAGDVSEAQRGMAIDRFQSGKIRYIAFTVAAGGAGITLTRAPVMVAVERPWSPIQWAQAQDRVHRIGSEIHDKVSIIDLITDNSVELRQMERFRDNSLNLEDVVRDKDRVKELLFG